MIILKKNCFPCHNTSCVREMDKNIDGCLARTSACSGFYPIKRLLFQRVIFQSALRPSLLTRLTSQALSEKESLAHLHLNYIYTSLVNQNTTTPVQRAPLICLISCLKTVWDRMTLDETGRPT